MMLKNELEFDESTHTYNIGDRKLISVTQGISILDTRWRDPWYLTRGKYIHKATELYDRDELDEDRLDPQIRPYLDAYVKFKEDTGFLVRLIEHKLFHPQHKYAGRIDRTGILNGVEDLIDIKSGTKVDTDELQGAGYWGLCKSNNIPIRKIFGLYLKENGTYSLVEVKNPKSLLPVFLAALTLTRWKNRL